MITKEITFCGKQITLGYCFATEIAYKDLAGEEMLDYAEYAVECLQSKRDIDNKRTILAIIACMMAYYQDEELPLKDSDIIKEATPIDKALAILTILELRAKFYEIPKGEPKDKEPKGGKKRKNA